MDGLNTALTIFALVITTLTVERTMNVFFGKRKTSKVIFVLSYLFFLAVLGMHIHEAVDMLLHFIALALISLNYESVAMKRVAAVAGSHYILIGVTEITSSLTQVFVGDGVITNQVLAVMVVSLVVYVISITIFPLFKHIKNPAINLNKLWLPLIILPVSHTLILLFRQINFAVFSALIVVLHTLGVILLFFYLYNTLSKVFESTLKSALHSQEKEYYFNQCRLMQESVENTKAIRHDMQLHLTAARDFITNGKPHEAKSYLSGLIADTAHGEIYSNTKNIAFDSIINYKLNNAMHESIQLDLRLLIPPFLNIEVADIVIIIGNLLDNALDAVAKVENKQIRLDIEYTRGSLFIQMENTFDGVVRYSVAMGEEAHIATRKDGEGHGHGLKNIRKSVDKYNGHFDIKHEDNIFLAVVLLYVDDVEVA